MKQLENNKLCKFCMGCERLNDENFIGIVKCNNFISAYENWQEKYYKALKGEKKNGL